MSMSICFEKSKPHNKPPIHLSQVWSSQFIGKQKNIHPWSLTWFPNKKEIPNLETIIFSFHSFNFGAINLSESCPSAGGSGPFHGAKPAEFQWNSVGIPWTKLNGQKWNNISTNMIFFYIEGCSLEIWWYMTIYDDNNVKMNGILV